MALQINSSKPDEIKQEFNLGKTTKYYISTDEIPTMEN